jgi:hypothetical protein
MVRGDNREGESDGGKVGQMEGRRGGWSARRRGREWVGTRVPATEQASRLFLRLVQMFAEEGEHFFDDVAVHVGRRVDEDVLE